MTYEGAITQVAWLQLNYSRQYSPNMEVDRIKALAEQFRISYEGYSDEEVAAAYMEFLNERKDPPAISEVRSRLIYRKNNSSDMSEREISQRIIKVVSYKPPCEIVVRDGVKGYMMHREAIQKFWEDQRAGTSKGGSEYYYTVYPKKEFVPIGTDLFYG